MNRSVVGAVLLGCTWIGSCDGAGTTERSRAYLAWMKEALPEVASWSDWQATTGELPPDFDALPKSTSLPEPLRFSDGRMVRTASDWSARRADIWDLFQRYVTGSFPPRPALTSVVVLDETRRDGVVVRNVRLEFGPEGRGSLRVRLAMPDAGGPFPVMISPNLDGWAPALIRRGYASAGYAANDFMDDTAALREVYPDFDFAALPRRAWAVQLVVDHLTTLPQIDTARIAIFGYSRDGKMATMAAALDDRIAAVIAGSTGVGGVLPWRLAGEYGMGEGIETTTRMFPTWFHPRLRFFSGREECLPVDANLLVALIAPRACLMQYGWNDEVSNAWALEQCRVSALEVYEMLGHPERLDLLGVPGFHGANDQERCLDWLDMQFGRQPDTWRNELRFPWNWEQWRNQTGAVTTTVPRAAGLTTVNTLAEWEAAGATVRRAVQAMLGERPPYLAPPTSPGPRAPRGPVPGPTAGGRGGAGQVAPDIPAWVIARRIQEFGWLSPEQDDTDSRRIRFGANLTGDLFFPKGTADDAHLPTVIWLHGASYPLGYMWVYRRDLHPILALVKAGYAVFAFDQSGFGARQDEAAPFYQRHPRWSLLGRMVEDVQRAIDTLQQQSLVDAKRISLFGYTLGATVALHAAAIDPRIRSVVSISGFTPMRTDTMDRNTGGIARYSHLRGLIPQLGFFVGRESEVPYDFDQLIAAIAPRPVLVVQPQLDRGATPDEVRATVAEARRIYALLGATNRLALHEPMDYTRLPAATQNQVIQWMQRTLTSETPPP